MHEFFFQNIKKIFVAIDPITLIPIFASFSTKIPTKEIVTLGIKIFLISIFLLIFFAVFGSNFLKLIGISIISFQIAGGIFLFVIAFEMLFEARSKRKEKLISKKIDNDYLTSFAIFPISIPLIVGPSAITVSILISETFEINFFNIYTKILPLVIVMIFTVFIFITSKFTFNFLGKSVTIVLQKIFGIVLGALAIEFILDGFSLVKVY